jgi:hypothetical protein
MSSTSRGWHLRGQGIIVLFMLLAAGDPALAQSLYGTNEGFTTTPEWTPRKYVSVGILGGVMVANATDAYMNWWKGAEKGFTFYSEGWFNDPHLGIDKVGHFFGTYAMFTSTRLTLLYGGFEPETAFWWGVGVGIFNAFEIEIGDGFSNYGFDYADLVCGILGVGYGVLQTAVPSLRDFDIKVSYWSSVGFRSPANFVNDYDAMTVWLSVDLHNLLPENWARYWPSFLRPAVGYGTGAHETRREFMVGLDLQLSAFTCSSPDIRYVEGCLDLAHWPMPAAKFSHGAAPEYKPFLLR